MKNKAYFFILFVILLSNCSKMEAVRIEPEVIFEFDPHIQIDSTCMDNDKYNACLFVKNPVHHRGESFESAITSKTALDEWQTAGVKVISQSAANDLDNVNVSVQSIKHEKASLRQGNWKYLYKDGDQVKFEQVSAFYWASYATSVIEDRTGNYWAKGNKIKIYLDDTYVGYSPNTNSIHMIASNETNALSLNADLLIYFVGLANLHYAGNGQMQDLSTDKEHRNCSKDQTLPKKNFCCRSVDGCSKAIASGVADYFVALIFPQAPTVGESWTNSMSGMKSCGISRDLREISTISLSEAFSSCSNISMEGHPITMGSIYASMWWEIRKKAKQNFTDGDIEIDRLYQQHLIKLDGADSFITAYQKIIMTDRELSGGKYASYFSEEFRRRGLTVD